MKELVLVKLGGSLITDKETPRTARPEVITRLAQEISSARDATAAPILLGHGSGSFGHPAAHEYGLQGKLATARQRAGASITQVHAARLHRQMVEALHEAGALPYSIAPSSCFEGDAGAVVQVAMGPTAQALEMGLLPVVYGDVITDRRWGATVVSTETVLLELARRCERLGLRPTRALWLGETEGILDRRGHTIATVSEDNLDQVRAAIGATRGTDVTGGMALRLDTVWRLARLGVSSHLFDGRVPGALERALLGRPGAGTQVLADSPVRTAASMP